MATRWMTADNSEFCATRSGHALDADHIDHDESTGKQRLFPEPHRALYSIQRYPLTVVPRPPWGQTSHARQWDLDLACQPSLICGDRSVPDGVRIANSGLYLSRRAMLESARCPIPESLEHVIRITYRTHLRSISCGQHDARGRCAAHSESRG